MTQTDDQLGALADYLHAGRPRVLRSWQNSVAHDPELASASTMSRSQFNDHIPQVLNAFEHRLRAQDSGEKHQARVEQRENAAEHGLQRWQQGYNQWETMREWGHLHLCVLRELDDYERERTGLDAAVMPTARAALVRLCAEGVCESAARYAQLQQTEAASRVRELEHALQQLQALDRQRAQIWREAAHDLRGTVGVIATASALVTNEAIAESARFEFSQVLHRNVASLRELLTDLTDLARLEAGQEKRQLVPFDAAHLLKDLCESLRDVAASRNLFLKTEGPAALPVEGDAVKVRRIVQNLLLNAFKATDHGGVRVSWQEQETAGAEHWVVCVQDTGPGLDSVHASVFEHVLQQATTASQATEVRAGLSGETDGVVSPAPVLASQSGPPAVGPSTGEGIGLAIVKRLCELLDASLELQTAPGSGTTFRLTFPRRYQSTTIVQG